MILLVNMLNNALKRVPTIADELEEKIRVREWNGKRTEHAIRIVQQLKQISLCELDPDATILEVQFEPLYLTLIRDEIAEISNKQSLYEVDQYVEELVMDINKLSKEICFSYSGHDYDGVACACEIKWYI